MIICTRRTRCSRINVALLSIIVLLHNHGVHGFVVSVAERLRHSSDPWDLFSTQELESVESFEVNGEKQLFSVLEQANVTILQDELLPEAPPLSYEKFLKMQDKRVVVTCRYSEHAGLKPYFLTVAKKLKASHPDVIIERRILPGAERDDMEATFEVLVDGKVIIGKGRPRKQKVARVDMTRAKSVFISMQELDLAISRARRRRRPSSVYGDEESFNGR